MKEIIKDSCNMFIQKRVDEIQQLMHQCMSILDIFYYYQDKYELSWHDAPTFHIYFKKAGLKYTDEELSIIKEKKYAKSSQTHISRDPEAKAATYEKYKKTLDAIPKAEKQAYIAKRQQTKANYTEEQKQHYRDAITRTKRLHNTFNTSKPEIELYNILISKYGKDDVLKQYKDRRYPFCCDFYIKSLDTFIELNGHFTHGPHQYDEENEQDRKLVAKYKSKDPYYINSKGKTVKSYYQVILRIWTEKDPEKLTYVTKNNLKMIIMYPKNIVYKYNTNLDLDFNYQGD